MRILLIILQFPPDVNSNGLLLEQVGEGLTQRGHAVSVVTTFPHYARFRVWDEYRGKLAQREAYHGMDVLRLYVHARGAKERMLDRFLSYFSFSFLATIAGIVDRKSYDVILCPNGGFLTGVAAGIVGAFKRIPVVLNIQDLYPETPIHTGQIRSRFAIRVLRMLEHWMYRAAGHITVITPAFRHYLVAKAGVPATKISVIPNFVDTDFIRPLAKENAFTARQSLWTTFVVSHAGNVGLAYDLETLVEAARLLAGFTDILILVVGDGVLKTSLEATVQRLGLGNVRFLPYQPHEDLPLLRAASDVQLVLTREGASMHSMPSKVYEIMASGRPVVASADVGSDLWQLVYATHCGTCVQPRDPAALAESILTLYRNPAARASMGLRGRDEALQHYSRPRVIQQYEDLLTRVTGSTAPPTPRHASTPRRYPSDVNTARGLE